MKGRRKSEALVRSSFLFFVEKKKKEKEEGYFRGHPASP